MGVPARPCAELAFPGDQERLTQRGARKRRCGLGVGAEPQRQHRLARQLSTEGDVARAGRVIVPGEGAVAREILPAVAGADVAGTHAAPGVALLRIHREQRQREAPLLGREHASVPVIHDTGDVVGTAATQVRREQYVGAQGSITAEVYLDHEHVAVLARDDAQAELEALVPVHDVHRWAAGRGEFHAVLPQALDLHPETGAVGDDEAEIADLRQVDSRVVDLVDDPAADREPQARGAQRAADDFLGAAAPGRRQSGSTRCDAHQAPLPRRRGGTLSSPPAARHRRTPPMNALLLLPCLTPGGRLFRRTALPPPRTT